MYEEELAQVYMMLAKLEERLDTIKTDPDKLPERFKLVDEISELRHKLEELHHKSRKGILENGSN